MTVRCAICGEPPNRHNGPEKFCPMYATYRPSAPKLDEGVIAEVKELRELLAKATPRPWYKYHSGAPRAVYADYDGACCKVAQFEAGRLAWGAAHKGVANAELVVAAINALPRLLTLIEGGGK